MQTAPDDRAPSLPPRAPAYLLAALLLLCPLLTGCLSSLSRHSTALALATAPLVDQAAAAYDEAQKIHDLRVDYDAVAAFPDTQTVYNPRDIQPLLTDHDIRVRLAVLLAFQCYVRSLVDITTHVDSPAQDAASKSVGSTLATLGNSLAPTIERTRNAAATLTPAPITPVIRNGISTAVDALSQFLVSRKIRKQLPQRIKQMDPHLEALCDLLTSDLDLLEDQEHRDYNSLVNQQTLFLRENTTLDPQERREQIMRLPAFVRQQRHAGQQLTELRASIARLAVAHHALAAAAQDDRPVSLHAGLAELSAAGNDLGKFYTSLPAQ